MAVNAGKINAHLSLDFKQFAKGLQDSLKQVRNMGKQFQTTFKQATSSIKETSDAAEQLKRDFKDIGRIVSGIIVSQTFYNLKNSIQDAANTLFQFMNDMQKAQIAMEYFLGTPERAQGFIVNMKDFAASTAFSTQQALDLSKRLMAAQFRPEEVRSIMEILNDAAAATGATSDQIDRIVLALTQIRTNGKLAGQEIRQLAEANIPIYTILQEQLGLTGEQLMNIGDLKVPGDLAVLAVLKGLQQRYEGAAQRIADTVPGMLETIRDDTLILGEAIFQAPYKAFEDTLRTWRDTLEKARDVLTRSGLGGVVEEMFSPEAQQSIRVVVGSMASLVESFRMLQKAMAPVVTALGESFRQILTTVTPIIAAVVRVLSTLASVALNTIPPLRWLMTALVGLLVARAAATSLMFLWKVMRLGVIAAAVAKAVHMLRAAIQALYLAMTRNPIAAVIMVISAALLYLALSSKTATKWLDQLIARLSALAGFKVDDILQPEDSDLSEWADEFNEEVSGIDENLQDVAKEVIEVGDEAKKSGKKIKDTFVAAFDEVFQVPELDKLDDSLKLDSPLIPMGPSLSLPKIPDEITPKIKPEVDWPELPDWLKDTPLIVRINVEPPIWPQPPSFPTAVATAWEFSMNAIRAATLAVAEATGQLDVALQRLKQALQGAGAAVPALVDALNLIPVPLINVRNVVVEAVSALASGVQQAFNGLVSTVQPLWEIIWSNIETTLQTHGSNVLNWLATNVPQWVASLETAGKQIELGWVTAWTNVVTTLQTYGSNVWNWLTTNVPQWVASLETAGKQIDIDWSTVWSSVLTTLITTGTQIATKLGTYASQWRTTLATKFSEMTTRAKQFKEDLLTTITTLASDLLAKWSLHWEQFKTIISDGLGRIKEFWEKHKESILSVAGLLVVGIISVFAGLPGRIISIIISLLSRLGPLLARIGPLFRTAIQNVPKIFREIFNKLPDSAKTIVTEIVKRFRELPGKIWDAIKSIPDKVAGVFSQIKIPSFNISGSFGKLANIAGFASGGIIDEDSIVRVGERGKREAIIPLENQTAMAPFARAVAAELRNMMPTGETSVAAGGNQPILYVGTLIADDRSLKELERRMRVIRMSEQARGVF